MLTKTIRARLKNKKILSGPTLATAHSARMPFRVHEGRPSGRWSERHGKATAARPDDQRADAGAPTISPALGLRQRAPNHYDPPAGPLVSLTAVPSVKSATSPTAGSDPLPIAWQARSRPHAARAPKSAAPGCLAPPAQRSPQPPLHRRSPLPCATPTACAACHRITATGADRSLGRQITGLTFARVMATDQDRRRSPTGTRNVLPS